jgi:hypothetical protein
MRFSLPLPTLLALTLVGLLFGGPAALGQSEALPPMETDRPDFTEGTSTVPAGHFQLEGGLSRSSSGDERLWTFGEVLVRIGLDSRWEARIGLNSYDRLSPGGGERTVSGAEDPTLGFKLRLSETEGARGIQPSAVSLIVLTSVPIGAEGLSADAWQPEVKLASAWDLTPRFSLSGNLIYAYLEDDGGRFSQIGASVSAGIELNERLGSFVEAYGFSREETGGDATGYVDTGLTYAINDNLGVDLRAGVGLQGPSPNYFVGVGAAIRF